MKIVKMFMTFFLLVMASAIAIASPVVVPLSGDWEWVNAPESQTFSIHLAQHGRNLIGQYCAVTQSGNKIDCDADKNPNTHGVLDDLPMAFGLTEGDAQRKDKPIIPQRVLREGIVNAVMHRSYRSHAPIHCVGTRRAHSQPVQLLFLWGVQQ